MVSDGQYLAAEPAFKEYAYAALMSRFPDRKGFEHFDDALTDPSVKDEFLRVISFYLFLVKRGE